MRFLQAELVDAKAFGGAVEVYYSHQESFVLMHAMRTEQIVSRYGMGVPMSQQKKNLIEHTLCCFR